MTAVYPTHLSNRIKVALDYPLRRSVSVTVELITPLHIGAGDEGEVSDATVVLDANGLATIPGSSIKGVFRSAFARVAPPEISVDSIFGFQKTDQGQGARIRVTWGRVHDQSNQPVKGILEPGTFITDKILDSAATPELRDHVLINRSGISQNKFDELSVPAGHRFSFRIDFISDQSESDNLVWATLLGILRQSQANPGHLRFGGKTRRGFGAVKVVSLTPTPDAPPRDLPNHRVLLHEIALVPDGNCFWMFGGGEDPQKDGTESDSSPVRAGKVVWNGDTGRFEPDVLVIPGSSMKGPVRHRTRYHLCRRQGVWAEHATPADLRQVDIALSLLFGDVDLENNEGAPDRKSPGDRVRAGCIYLDDLYLDGREGAPPAPDSADIQNHVTIDRVLGGAQDHHLFTDRPLHGGGFTLRIGYEEPHKVRLNQRELELLDLAGDPEDAKARELLGDAKAALASAVEDLKNGLLALGAHGNRGYGWFRVDD